MSEDRQPRGIKLNRSETDTPEGTYEIEVYCDNCDWEGNVDVPKGTPAPYEEPVGNIARCEHCGCYTLVRHPYEDPEEVVQEDTEVQDNIQRQLERLQREAARREIERNADAWRERIQRWENVVPQIPREPAAPTPPPAPAAPRPNFTAPPPSTTDPPFHGSGQVWCSTADYTDSIAYK